MKSLKIIQLSRLSAPRRVGHSVSVNYLEGFWLRLFWDVIIELFGLTVGAPLRFSRPQIKALDCKLSFKRAAFLFMIVVLSSGFALRPHDGHTVYADPIFSPLVLKPLRPLKLPDMPPQAALETALHTMMAPGTYPNSFAPGNCTAGVASRLPVTWSGNANEWAANAAAQGYTVSSVPRVGAIAASSTVYYLGHVGIVTSITDGVTIWEENYNGLYSTDERMINVSDYLYIYF